MIRKKLSGFICVALVIAALTLPFMYTCWSSSANYNRHQKIVPTIAQDATTPALYHYEATKETSIEDEAGDLSSSGNYLVRSDGDSHYLVGLDGANVMSQPIKNVSFVDGDCAVVETEDSVTHNKGIASLSRGVLVKPEAALINPVTCEDGEPRFVEVTYATARVNDPDLGFVYVSDSGYATSYFGNGDDYDAYQGYTLVFDLEAGAFVDGVKIEQVNTHIYDFGDSFLVVEPDHQSMIRSESKPHNVLYEPSGKELWNGDGTVYCGAHSFCISSLSSPSSIVDAAGTTRYTTEGSLYPINKRNDLYRLSNYSSNEQNVIDVDGTVVFECADLDIVSGVDDMYEVRGETYSDPNRIIDQAGELVCKGSHLTCVLPGYATINTGKQDTYDLYSLYSGGELLASNLDTYSVDTRRLIFDDGDPNDNNYRSLRSYYVFADHSCTLKLTACDKLDVGLVSGEAEQEAPRGVYDLFTGEAVIPALYDKIVKAGNYVFAHADNSWDVYRVQRLGPE